MVECGIVKPPKWTLSEAKSSRRGRAYKSREDRTAIKLRLGKANLVRFWDKTASQVLG